MKKITLILSILAVVLASCKDKNAYTIDGSFNATSYDGKTVYLQKLEDMEQMDPIVVDSAVVKDGKFHFEGVAEDKPSIRFISLGKLSEITEPEADQPTVATFVLEAGAIEISFDKASLSIKGTPRNDEFNKIHDLSNQMVALYKEATASTLSEEAMAEKRAKMNDLMKQMQDVNYKFTKENMNNPVGEFIFLSSVRSLEKEQISELLALSDSSFQNKPQVKQLKEMLEMQLQRDAAVLNHPVQDAQVADQSGKKVSLSAYTGKGKVVLLDFWASWCAPCIQEMPSLVKAYAKYKDKGFEIVGVSLDQDKSAWQNAVKSNNMTWVQLIDAEGDAAKVFEISSIPFTLLLDKEGNVYAMNLRGDDLEKKLEELFK